MDTTTEPTTVTEFEALMRLSRDLKKASKDLPRKQARYIVDTYYQVQQFRIRLGNQIQAATSIGEPVELLGWVQQNMVTLESDLRLCLGEFARAYKVGRWCLSICGIGYVLAAGLLSQFDIRKAPTAGQFWRFAGLDPSLTWLGKVGAEKLVSEILGKGPATETHLEEIATRTNRHPENIRRLLKDGKLTKATLTAVLAKRPWSNETKCLCAGKIADSFVKVQPQKNDFYGAFYGAHRAKEVVRNQEGDFVDQAKKALSEKKFGKDTASFKFYSGLYLPSVWDQWYETESSKREAMLKEHVATKGDGLPMLPPLHLHNRAERYAVKLFISHLHAVMYRDYHGEEGPKPYAFEKLGDKHRHFVEPPNYHKEFTGKGLAELYG